MYLLHIDIYHKETNFPFFSSRKFPTESWWSRFGIKVLLYHINAGSSHLWQYQTEDPSLLLIQMTLCDNLGSLTDKSLTTAYSQHVHPQYSPSLAGKLTQYRNCSMTTVPQTLTSLKGTAGILNKISSLQQSLLTQCTIRLHNLQCYLQIWSSKIQAIKSEINTSHLKFRKIWEQKVFYTLSQELRGKRYLMEASRVALLFQNSMETLINSCQLLLLLVLSCQ